MFSLVNLGLVTLLYRLVLGLIVSACIAVMAWPLVSNSKDRSATVDVKPLVGDDSIKDQRQ